MVLGAVGYACVSGGPWPAAWGARSSPEKTLSAYLSLMHEGKLERLLDSVIDGLSVGYDPHDTSTGMPLEEAEAKGLVRPLDPAVARRLALDTLARQREFVRSEFGENAWAEASFSLQPEKQRPTRAVYIDRAANREVDEQTAMAVLEAFWEDVEAREGLNPSEIVGMADNVPPGMTAEQFSELTARAEQVLLEYEDQVPIIFDAVATVDGYRVRFIFGNGVSETGVWNFQACLAYRGGEWRLSEFQWEEPSKPPESDI